MKYSQIIETKLIPYINKKDSDWTVDYDKVINTITFGKYSPAGQDFRFTVDCGNEIGDLSKSINRYFENYDVSEEAYIWLDNTGHGKNGAPYDMKDVYEDMQACEQFIDDMFFIVDEFEDDYVNENEV